MSDVASGMTKREMNLRVFRGEPLPHVFFQPRMEPWYDWHVQMNQMPPDYAGICLLYTSPSPRDLSTSRMPSSA